MKDYGMVLSAIMFSICLGIGYVIAKPEVKPCDGQLVTGAIGRVEFRYCVHPTVAR